MRQASNAGISGALAAVGIAVALLLVPAAEAAPKRIVALTPFSANTLANLGVTPVAIGETLGGHSRFSKKLSKVKRLTLSHPNGPNMEELAVLNPEVVFSSPTWAKGAKTMRDLEIKVLGGDPGTVDGLYDRTRYIGKAVGRSKQASKLADKLREQVAKARKGIHKRPRVMVVLGVGRKPFVFLPNSWGGDVVRKAGGRLVTGGVTGGSGFQSISDEVVVKANPDVIIAVPHANADDLPAVEKYLKSNPAWKNTKAVKKDRLYISSDNSLLQAGTDAARVIRMVRNRYLKN